MSFAKRFYNDKIKKIENKTFDDIKHIDEKGIEFSESLAEEHFSQLGKSLDLPNGAKKYIENYDYMLTCYACYFIAQNGSPRKNKSLLHKHILQFKLESRKLLKKNIVQYM